MIKKWVLFTSFVLALAFIGTRTVCGDVWEGLIASSTDDREHYVGGDLESAASSDLEMPYEGTGQGSPQVVGLRFANVGVSSGATITSAYIEFVCDETKGGSDHVSLIIEGQKSADAVTFNDTVIGRARTDAHVVWVPSNWTAEGQVDRTSDIARVIQEIIRKRSGEPNPADGAVVEQTSVNLSWTQGWKGGNALAIIISNNPDDPSVGLRCAEAWDGSAADAALLHIEFTPGEEITITHDVYFGDNFDDVNNDAGDTFLANQSSGSIIVGCPRCPYSQGLVPGMTYYWRIDDVEADGTTHKGPIWSFTLPPSTATDPVPADGSKYMPTDTTLSWTAGLEAQRHTVYFGDDYDTVNNATEGAPVTVTTYDPGPLEKNMTYYWRVDEFDGVETHKGDVWSFSTLVDFAVADPDLIGWWKFDEAYGATALDFSGYGNDATFGGDPQRVEGILGGALELDGSDYVVIDDVVDDITSTNITLSVWIKSTQTAQGDVFAANNSASSHPLEFYIEGGYPGRYDGSDATYTTAPFVADDQWHMLTYVREGSTAYIYVDGVQVASDSASFDLSTVTRWSIGQEWDDTTASNFYIGLVDDARFYNKALTAEQVLELTRGDPLLAWNPSPSNGAVVDVERARQPLSWSPGDLAAEHDVYFGLDKTTVENADSSDVTGLYRGRQVGTTYAPPGELEWGTGPYYWRIDEINTDGTLTTGAIWSFTIADHLIVEDFESYTDNDMAGEAIWQAWIDGFGVIDNGAQVGYLLPPYAERTIVHGGEQSMPFMYDNTAGVKNSEAEFTLTALRDWTAHDVSELSIWFRGYPGSVGNFVEAPAGTYTMTASGT
ncbi:MAG: LamG domain-containing protein, partial [Sedimentisphaerales bacterium]|nr:LamG domain-containing protein [Sedimentisphaerales bacterium]